MQRYKSLFKEELLYSEDLVYINPTPRELGSINSWKLYWELRGLISKTNSLVFDSGSKFHTSVYDDLIINNKINKSEIFYPVMINAKEYGMRVEVAESAPFIEHELDYPENYRENFITTVQHNIWINKFSRGYNLPLKIIDRDFDELLGR